MDIKDVQEGDVLKILHARKGLVTVIAGKQDDSEWFKGVVAQPKVTGWVNEWLEGERLPLRKSLIQKITKVPNVVDKQE